MKQHYRAVVVGGGVIGSSTAAHLAARLKKQHGAASTLLLEGETLTSGTTWHAAGMVTHFKGSPILSELAQRSAQKYSGWKDIGWHTNGSIALARSPERWRQFLLSVAHLDHLGVPYQLFDKAHLDALLELHPLVDIGHFHGAVYLPTDGIVNPADVSMRIAQEARSEGAEIVQNCTLQNMTTEHINAEQRVSTLHTSKGDVTCDNVVIAGGQWTREICSMIPGVMGIPVAPASHQYVIFDKVQGVSNRVPVVRDFDSRIYIKPEVGGLAVGVFEANPKPQPISRELYGEDLEKSEEGLMAAMECIPAIQEVGIKSSIHGADAHSIDHYPVLGRLPFTTNAFVAAGFNSQGIQLGYGIGELMADIVLGNVPAFKYDTSALDVARFTPGLTDDVDFCKERALESYGQMYSIPYPGMDWVSHRERRKSPLHDTWLEKGAVFGTVPSQGWERPLWYGDGRLNKEPYSALTYNYKDTAWYKAAEYEHHACRKEVALFDMTSFGKFLVSGKDAYATLEHLTSTHLEPSMVGNKVVYTQLLNKDGGIESDLTVVPLPGEEPSFYCVTGSGIVQRDMSYIAHMGDAIHVADVSGQYAVLALMGPRSKAILQSLTSEPLDDESFPFGTWRDLGFALALRMSFVGELGWELHVPFENARSVYVSLNEASVALFGAPLPLGGYNAILRSLRVEKRFVHFGHDVSGIETPLEAGLLAVNKKLKSNCDFLGREALLRQKDAKVRKRLVSFMLSDDTPVWGHENVFRNGELVGYLTTGGVGYTVNEGRCIGLGYVFNKHGAAGKAYILDGEYMIEACGRMVPAVVSFTPLYDAKNERMRCTTSVLAAYAVPKGMPLAVDGVLFKK